ncbi:winged helix-turn-helix domain-containing protein [Clostridium transplantifaecale]|uniref:winged helix-turn-helix domain-containing protein n=1 Tax=Clostridium transplantifaecale TaxID=2479838 RepID=UPI0013DDA428|nr:helix-turn-helix domain-containing protein [Clostridium transplantifaecale]
MHSQENQEILESSVPEEGVQNGEKEQEQSERERTDEVSNLAPAYSLTLPETWKDRVIDKKSGTSGQGFYQKSSYERMGDGLLFYIEIWQNGEYINMPDYEIWGHAGQVLTREQLYSQVWDNDNTYNVDNLVKAHMKQPVSTQALRKKLSWQKTSAVCMMRWTLWR